MKNSNSGIRVFAVNNYKVQSRFDIYLEFPGGRREWLMMHRRNGLLYNKLKNGVRLQELKELSGRDRNNFKYILRVIDEYLADEEVA